MNAIIVFLGFLAAANAGVLYDGHYDSQFIHGLDYSGFHYGYNYAYPQYTAYAPAVKTVLTAAPAPIVYQPAPVVKVVQAVKPRVVQTAPPPITISKYSVPAKRDIVVPAAPAQIVYQQAPVVKIAQPVVQTVAVAHAQPILTNYGYSAYYGNYGGYAPTYFNYKK